MAISARLVRDAIIRISALINVLVGTDFNLIISWPETELWERPKSVSEYGQKSTRYGRISGL